MRDKLFAISRRGDIVRLWLSQDNPEEQIQIKFAVNQHVGELQDLRLLARDVMIAEIAHEVLLSHWIENPEVRLDLDKSSEFLTTYLEKAQFIQAREIHLEGNLEISELVENNTKDELAHLLISYMKPGSL